MAYQTSSKPPAGYMSPLGPTTNQSYTGSRILVHTFHFSPQPSDTFPVSDQSFMERGTDHLRGVMVRTYVTGAQRNIDNFDVGFKIMGIDADQTTPVGVSVGPQNADDAGWVTLHTQSRTGNDGNPKEYLIPDSVWTKPVYTIQSDLGFTLLSPPGDEIPAPEWPVHVYYEVWTNFFVASSDSNKQFFRPKRKVSEDLQFRFDLTKTGLEKL